jgi:ubiquinone/menaquinone biosynthesis C-methylase UbiE
MSDATFSDPTIAMGFAEGYQCFMGRWSERLAERLLYFCGVGEGEIVLDVGCGLGSLVRAILARTGATIVIGIDRHHEAVTAARLRVSSRRAAFQVGDARQMPYPDGAFDRCIALLVLIFLPDYRQAAAEMVRLTRNGGVIGAAAWDFAGGLLAHRLFYDTAAALDPNFGFRQGFSRPLQQRGELAALWKESGLTSVEETALTIWMEFHDFADYWAAYAWATDEYLRRISDSSSTRLIEAVRAAYLAGAADGPRAFAATAWAVRGLRS